jgi:hypothetical protein
MQMVVRMECSGLDCGRRPAAMAAWNQSRAVGHGDWPWQVALSRNGDKASAFVPVISSFLVMCKSKQIRNQYAVYSGQR